MASKKCICCGKEKPMELFSKHPRMRDGHLNKCKPCCVEYARNRRASKPADVLRAERHAEYERQVAKGNRTRERSLSDIRNQSDPLDRKIRSLRYMHKQRVPVVALTELDELVFDEAVRLSHARAEATGIRWEIDHVVPVKGKAACGLHNAFNLQVVPKRWNELKSNTKIEHFFARA